ncbi:MAG: carbohydrate-binding protein [Oribacterium sp.]|jgi:hypothetical protein|nr:carbohydrate-binding protein [Oribacterium sp.]MDY6307727.1 carbohydrate-binding protein [Oribacterium sp.]MDY6316422.1 carbohydrate-binding protein [Oribacterium sp.]
MKISVYNSWDHVPKAEAEGEEEAVLAWNGEYRKNDFIEFTELTKNRFYVVTLDAAVPEAVVYVTADSILYEVPFYEKKTSYNPLAFFGNRHYIRIRLAENREIYRERDLALNPFDQHEVSGVYPHASANIETRGEAVFAARNAIDGCVATGSHGEWPYESWGINRREDAEFRIDFGRPVNINEIRLYTRADFPHDSWWKAGTFTFSDGTEETVQMEKRAGTPHSFSLKRENITWLTLHDLKKASDPSPFPALTEIEVFGTEGNVMHHA